MSQLPYLNLGCGKTHYPATTPYPGHEILPLAVPHYPQWVNVDKVSGVGADKVFDLFEYPWPLADNSFDGALLAHIAEHIPHEIRLSEHDVDPVDERGVLHVGNGWFDKEGNRATPPPPRFQRQKYLSTLQDGWYAFLSELWRVLTPGAVAHIVAPYGKSDGAIVDPTHTRYLTPQTFMHALDGGAGNSTFRYEVGCNYRMTAPPVYQTNPMFQHLQPQPEDTEEDAAKKYAQFEASLITYWNVAFNFYVQIEAVK